MTKLDQFVKRAMLVYPGIFPTRISVLTHTFLVLGNGIDWQDDGTLDCADIHAKYTGHMNYRDLDERLTSWAAILGEDSIERMRENIEANIAVERADYQWREAHIDVLASTPDTTTIFPYGPHRGYYEKAENVVRHIAQNHLPFATLPKNVEPSFLAGGIEVLDAVIRSTEEGDTKNKLIAYRNSLTTV